MVTSETPLRRVTRTPRPEVRHQIDTGRRGQDTMLYSIVLVRAL